MKISVNQSRETVGSLTLTQFQMNGTMLLVLISTVNLFISFITAEYVYSGNTLVPYSVILVSTFVGLEVLLYLFVVPLSELVDSIDRKRKGSSAVKTFVAELPIAEEAKVETVEVEAPTVNPATVNSSTATETFVATPVTEAVKDNAIATTPLPSVVETCEEKPVPADIQAIFDRSDAQMREQEAKIKAKKKELFMIYLYEILAPLLPQKEIDALWIEFEGWIDHSKYHPKGRDWKWMKNVNSFDVRHLVWNIGKRLGKEYDGDCCAQFTMLLFPDICKEIQKSSIRQNLTAEPDKGYIKLDRPEKGNSFKFHTDTEHE